MSIDGDWLRWGLGAGVTAAVAAFWKLVAMIRKEEEKRSAVVRDLHERVDKVLDKAATKDDLKSMEERTQHQFDKVDKKLDRLLSRDSSGGGKN